MSLFTVDEEKCGHDGICVAECPFGLLKMETPKSTPRPITGADEVCFDCGHCVAICPHGALSLKTMPVEECVSVKKELSITQEKIEQLLKSRRSVRLYKDKKVDKKILEQLLNNVRYAPTGHNSQLVNWLIIYDSDQVNKLKGMTIDWMRKMLEENSPLGKLLPFEMFINAWDQGIDAIGHSAPHLIVVHAPQSYPVASVDCTIAFTYLELTAHVMDLGVCWAGAFNIAAGSWQPLQDALGLPEGNTSFGTMMIGYPKYKYHRIPIRNKANIAWL